MVLAVLVVLAAVEDAVASAADVEAAEAGSVADRDDSNRTR